MEQGPAGRARALLHALYGRFGPRLFPALLAASLCLAAALRLFNLPGNPGWYTDEGAHLDIAWHLSQGRFQFLALTQSVLLAARLPLFELLLAAALKLPGEGIALLRVLTGSLGVVSVGMLAALAWVGQGSGPRQSTDLWPGWLALLAAALLAVYQPAVIYSRFGFSYNLITPLVLLAGIGLLKYWEARRWRWLLVAALAAGVGLVSDVWMGVMVLPVLLGALERRWRRWLPRALAALGAMALPISLYVVRMLATAPQAFLFDARYTLGRLGVAPFWQQLGVLADNVAVLGTQTPWFALGVAGLLFLPPRLRLVSLLLFALPFCLLGRTTALYSLSFYYLIPLLPFIPLGIAALVWRLGSVLLSWLRDSARTWAKVLLAASAGGFVVAAFVQVYARVWSGFATPVDDFLLNPGDARAAAAYVNSRARPADLVIASPGLAWLVCGRGAPGPCRVADYQMAVAASGLATPHMPANLPPDRWAFDPRFARARYVVVDNLWRNWAAVYMPPVEALLRSHAGWEAVFVRGDITVYYVPDR